MGTRQLRQPGLYTAVRDGGWCCQLASRFQSLGTASQRPPLTRQNSRRTCRIAAQQTSTAYDVVYTSDAPYYVLEQQKSMLQKITVVKFADNHVMKEVAGATALILDASGSIHSLYRENTPITGSYWDIGSLLPGLVPDGPIGILGLASPLHPDVCHVGDALAEDAAVSGGFAGIVVDLFAEGQVLPALQQVEVWKQMAKKLKPGGRVLANISDNRALAEAVLKAFPEAQGHVPINANTRNYVALTGPPVSEDVWQTFPEQLKYCTTGWQPLQDLSWDL
ncbi:MAG: hypothetical protein FRX49_08904 [Trebouxia sp. A1-2]|nr:MAG: hypothetical protein FRX49_08904 [Trebouxia sp. A1-2]